MNRSFGIRHWSAGGDPDTSDKLHHQNDQPDESLERPFPNLVICWTSALRLPGHLQLAVRLAYNPD